MAKANSTTIDEVKEYLQLRGDDYRAFLALCVDDLEKFRDRGRNRESMYRIYTRAAKQEGGDPLKKDWKIAVKLDGWRKTRPKASVSDIHDIIGMTVVTYFSSQLDPLVERLLERSALGDIEIVKKDQKDDDGYYAVHLWVRGRLPRYRDILCEIQVKTLLNDSWAAKTHDLSYKPKGQINLALKKQIELLGDLIQTLELQSDVLRTLIEEEVLKDERRRETAQAALGVSLAQDKNFEHDMEIASLATKIAKNAQHIKFADQSDPLFSELFAEWEAQIKSKGYCRATCRLITYLAGLRDSGDTDAIAKTAINKWVQQAADGPAKAASLAFRSVADYTLGFFEDAVIHAREALKYAASKKLKTAALKMNLAYFLAEERFQNPSKSAGEQAETEIRDLIRGIGKPKSKAAQISFMDSRGAILIAIASTPDEVREGIDLCRKAHLAGQSDPETKPLFDAYFSLHESRGLRRLLELI